MSGDKWRVSAGFWLHSHGNRCRETVSKAHLGQYREKVSVWHFVTPNHGGFWRNSADKKEIGHFLCHGKSSSQFRIRISGTRPAQDTKSPSKLLKHSYLYKKYISDIPQMTSNFVEIAPRPHLQGNCIPFAAIRWHDFGNRPAIGRPFGRFSCHPDTPLVSQSPCRRLSRPTPERVFVANHQSGPGFSGTSSSARQPRLIGT